MTTRRAAALGVGPWRALRGLWPLWFAVAACGSAGETKASDAGRGGTGGGGSRPDAGPKLYSTRDAGQASSSGSSSFATSTSSTRLSGECSSLERCCEFIDHEGAPQGDVGRCEGVASSNEEAQCSSALDGLAGACAAAVVVTYQSETGGTMGFASDESGTGGGSDEEATATTVAVAAFACALEGAPCGADDAGSCCFNDCNGGACGGFLFEGQPCANAGPPCADNLQCNGGFCGTGACSPDGTPCGDGSGVVCCNNDCTGSICGSL